MTVARIAASEADLVAVARALVSPHTDEMMALLAKHRTLPPKIGPTCAALVADALRQLWPELWRRDGGRPRAGLDARGGVARGRIWERHAPVRLAHTAASLRVLRWLVATPGLAEAEPLAAAPLELGDQVVIYLALAALDGHARRTLAAQPLVRGSPLAWLGFADVLRGDAPGFEGLAAGAGAIVVEALTGELAARWRAVELGKRAQTDPHALIALGAAQDAVLTGFMHACGQRRDLAAFVIDAATPVLARGLAPIPEQLDRTAPLAVRAAARDAAGALLRAIVRWRGWDDEHRGVRFVDDDYPRAQVLLARFEPIGRAGAERAAAWLAELTSLAPTTPAP
jgi:hypothetical protein